MSHDQRTEDLNPRSDDIEVRVKHLLDPAVTDKPATSPVAKSATAKTKIEIQSVSAPTGDEAKVHLNSKTDLLPSAPELPSKKNDVKPAESKNSQKVIIPISHHDEATADLDKKAANVSLEQPLEKPKTETKEEIEPIEPVANDIAVEDPAILADPSTDKAVEEIIAAEGDELLEVEDAVRDTDEPVKPEKKPRKSLLKTLKAWWAKPAHRWAVILLFLVSAIVAAVMPTSRYFLLNTAGVRASSSAVVLDQSTNQPLKNVNVTIGNVKSVTDEEGKVQLKKIKLGSSELIIEKRAFAQISQAVVVGLGSNPLGEFSLTPTGTQYSFTITEFLSGKPLTKVEASSDVANAISDDKGNIKLTIDALNDQKFDVSIKGQGYRTEIVTIDPDDKSNHDVKLVPARKQVFVSKRSGKYDIYNVYIDGKEEKLLLAGSGKEKDDMVLVAHPKEDLVAYVSTRAGLQNSDGFVMSNLILIHPEDSSTTNIVASERIQIVDWIDDNLVYVQIAAGSSANSPKRYRLMSYNYKDSKNTELASSNYFNDVIAADGSIYYATSSAYQTEKGGFYKIRADGSNKQTIFDQEVWNIFRTSFDHFALSVQQLWYDYQLGAKVPTKLNSAPANQTSRVYINNPANKYSVWVDSRDGKGVLLKYELTEKKDVNLRSQSGLGYPLSWLSDSVLVYRVKSDQETADYAISIDGGEPVKIRDVTNSRGIDRWYYY